MRPAHQSGNLAWCALIALALARQDGKIHSKAHENLFLTRWLATALSQKRFPKEATVDIEWLLKQGRQLGVNANLPDKLKYLYCYHGGDVLAQTDFFRLIWVVGKAQDANWRYQLLRKDKWADSHDIMLNTGVNAIYLLKDNINTAFDKEGHQLSPVFMRITGNVVTLINQFNTCNWLVKKDSALPHLYKLTASLS